MKPFKAPRAAGETAGLKLMESLELWAASLKAKQLVAVRVDPSEQSIEGKFWLAVLSGKAFTATEATLHETDTVEAGFLVVKARWLKLEQRDCEGGLRSYSVLDREFFLVVNTMVRLEGLKFADGKGGPQGRELRAPKGKAPVPAFQGPKAKSSKAQALPKEASLKLVYISRDTQHAIEACS